MSELTELNNKLDKLIDILLSQQTVNKQSPYTLYEFLEIWLKTYKKPKIKPYTVYQYNNVIRLYLKPNLLDKNLNDYTQLDIANALNLIPDCRQKETAYYILHDSLTIAYKMGVVSSCLMDTVPKYKHNRTEGIALTRNEQLQFLSLIKGTRFELIYSFMLFTGCRRGEALALRYEDIDLKNKQVLIRGTKTVKSRRYVPLFDCLPKFFFLQHNRKGVVFKISADSLTKSINKMGLTRKVKLKDLRTTFATRCMEIGISDKLIAKWLGHSSTATTKAFYEKIQDSYEQENSQKLAENFNNA